MDAIVNWIAKNPYLTAAGLLATFIALIIAIVTPIVQRKRKRLYYTVSTTSLLKTNVSGIKDVEVLFSGHKVEALSVSNIKIWNSGNTLIESSDFYQGHELCLVSKECELLGAELVGQSTDTVQAEIVFSPLKGIQMEFQAFEKRDYIALNVYHTGDTNTEFQLLGKMKEGKIVDKTIDMNEIILSVMDASPVGMGLIEKSLISTIAAAISLLISRDRSNK